MSNYIKTFGESLTRWKQESGWSDDRIAQATGLHRTTVAALRLGRNAPQWRTQRLCLDRLPGFRNYCDLYAPGIMGPYWKHRLAPDE